MANIKIYDLSIADEELLCNIADEESLSVNGGFLFPLIRFPDIPLIRPHIPWIPYPRPHIPSILPRC